ncbi:MAG: hypothetical protein FJ271_26765 [Planctomycetes bacterium]|nr:hypothetical protein [Planctomycetota bacterium]
MNTTLYILASTVLVGQLPDRAGWQLAPQLFPGLELQYAGSYTEEAISPGVQFQRAYRLRSTVFVIDSTKDGWNVLLMTELGLKNSRVDDKELKESPSSIRLELAQVDRKGRIVRKDGKQWTTAASGPPTVEVGAFVLLPGYRIGLNQLWETGEPGQPPCTWQALGAEMCSGTMCVKMLGQQQTEDWDRPRGDHAAWRRRDSLWVAPSLGIAYRVERTIERREPARRDPSFRSTVKYEMDSRLRYPGKLYDDRCDEIRKGIKFQEEALPLLAQPGNFRPQINVLLKRITYYLENNPPTPYRKGVLYVKDRLEQALRGEISAVASTQEQEPLIPVVRLGERAPDFLVTNLLDRQSVRLHRSLGRPLLIAFYNPRSENGIQVLQFAKSLVQKHGNSIGVLALAVSDEIELVRRQHADMKLPFPVLDGTGLHVTFSVEATPRLVVLDSEGIARAAYTGWGPQIPGEIEIELTSRLPQR